MSESELRDSNMVSRRDAALLALGTLGIGVGAGYLLGREERGPLRIEGLPPIYKNPHEREKERDAFLLRADAFEGIVSTYMYLDVKIPGTDFSIQERIYDARVIAENMNQNDVISTLVCAYARANEVSAEVASRQPLQLINAKKGKQLAPDSIYGDDFFMPQLPANLNIPDSAISWDEYRLDFNEIPNMHGYCRIDTNGSIFWVNDCREKRTKDVLFRSVSLGFRESFPSDDLPIVASHFFKVIPHEWEPIVYNDSFKRVGYKGMVHGNGQTLKYAIEQNPTSGDLVSNYFTLAVEPWFGRIPAPILPESSPVVSP